MLKELSLEILIGKVDTVVSINYATDLLYWDKGFDLTLMRYYLKGDIHDFS